MLCSVNSKPSSRFANGSVQDLSDTESTASLQPYAGLSSDSDDDDVKINDEPTEAFARLKDLLQQRDKQLSTEQTHLRSLSVEATEVNSTHVGLVPSLNPVQSASRVD